MDAFEKAAQRVPDWFVELLAVSKPSMRHADVFLHFLRQDLVEIGSSRRGKRFDVPQRTTRRTSIEGVSGRLIEGSSARIVATDDLSTDGLASLLREGRFEPGGPDDPSPEPRVDVLRNAGRTEDTDDLDTLALTIHDALLHVHPNVSSVKVGVAEITRERALAATGQTSEIQSDRHSCIEVRVAVTERGQTHTDIRTRSGKPGPDLDALALAKTIANTVAERSGQRRRPLPRLAGAARVLLPPGWGGVWLHEAVGHQLEADSILSAKSVFTKKFNQMVGPAWLTIVDTALSPDGRVRQEFDDEGTPSQETVVVDNGRLVGYLTDNFTSVTIGQRPSGNGRRAHYAQIPRPRMTNLLLKPGFNSPADLNREIDTGIAVSVISHAWFDPVEGFVYLRVDGATMIESGQNSGALAPLILRARPTDLLAGIVAVATDFSVDRDRGYCVKDGAAIPVGVGQPSVLVDGFETQAAG